MLGQFGRIVKQATGGQVHDLRLLKGRSTVFKVNECAGGFVPEQATRMRDFLVMTATSFSVEVRPNTSFEGERKKCH